MSDLKMHTANLVAKNIEKLTALFPNCITETRNEQGEIIKGVDFDLLRQELSDVLVEGEQERYTLNWVGKKESILAANAPIAKTLRPCREESVNFDTTENLFIEGDNLDALKLLQENYLGKVKMIYIDPPYNTGNDFIYNDDFAENTEEFLIRSNQIDDDGNRLIANTESNGRFHSDWLSMMYSRLRLARNLLRDDGVIFISIDDNEQANLKRICDEVWGEGNFVAELIINSNSSKNNSKTVSISHEYILCYAKSISSQTDDWKVQKQQIKAYESRANQLLKMNLTEDEIHQELLQLVKYPRFYDFDHYTYADEKGIYGTWDAGGVENGNFKTELVHPITGKICTKPSGGWRYKDETIKEMLEDGLISFGKDEKIIPRVKRYLRDYSEQVPKSNLFFDSQASTKWLKAEKLPFDFPKSTELIKHILSFMGGENDVVLDFFAGSGTTAHAVMQLNAEDNGNRKFICVQLPEKTDEKSEAFKAGYSTIAEITKERIRRAGSQILQNLDENKLLDVGFRVLKIDSSNMKDIYYQPEQYDKTMLDQMVSHIKEDRSAEDLLFQVMLDWGIELSLPIERKTIDGSEVYFVAGNTLVACFDKFTMNVVDEIAKVKPLRVVSTELAIMHDQDKTNIKERFKQLSPDTEVKFL